MCRLTSGFALLLGLLVLLLAPTAAETRPTVWTGTTVRVMDYTTPMWEGIVAGMVDEFNAMLPEAAPRLVYRRMPERACQDMKKQVVAGAIVVCSTAMAPYAGWTRVWGDRTEVIATRIVLNDRLFLTDRFATNTVCHELMHAVTGIKDKYDRRRKTSCVWGDLPAPGQFDVAYAQKVYEPADPR